MKFDKVKCLCFEGRRHSSQVILVFLIRFLALNYLMSIIALHRHVWPRPVTQEHWCFETLFATRIYSGLGLIKMLKNWELYRQLQTISSTCIPQAFRVFQSLEKYLSDRQSCGGKVLMSVYLISAGIANVCLNMSTRGLDLPGRRHGQHSSSLSENILGNKNYFK